MFKEYSIRPMAQSDVGFKQDVRKAQIEIPESGAHIVFYIPMPSSWSEEKKRKMDYGPHQCSPHLHQLLKTLLDATGQGQYVWDVTAEKRWSQSGMIRIEE
jgi:hypothetical protein